MWAAALDIDKDEQVEVLNQVFDIYQLTREIKTLIKLNTSLNHELYLASYESLEAITSPANFHKKWHELKGNFETDVLTRLEFCSQEIGKYYEEEKVSEEELESISKLANELFTLLEKSNIDDIAKLLLLEEIERIRSSISRYKIRGAKGVKEALQATLGAVVVNKEELEVIAKDNPDVLNKLGDLLDKLDTFSAKALKIHKALSKPVSFFLSLINKDDDNA